MYAPATSFERTNWKVLIVMSLKSTKEFHGIKLLGSCHDFDIKQITSSVKIVIL